MEIDGTKTSHFYLEIFAVYITMKKKKKASFGVIQSYGSLLLQMRTQAMIFRRLAEYKLLSAVIFILGRYSCERAVFTSAEIDLEK